jgi:RNA polymerase sigma factor (sigma-70 family)
MNSDELGRLIDRHAPALELYARQWCDTPEDVVQEAFLKLAEQGGLPDNPAAWLFRVVRNGAINASTAARRRRRHESGAAEARTWFQVESTASHPDAFDPESLTAELQALPLEQREVIVAHLWGGLTFEQIAKITGISSSTAHRQYCAGLSTLRERLGVSCHKTRTIPS